MGSSSSKFKKYLHNGDEFAAMQVFQSSPELQKSLNPNLSYGESYNHDTALHFAAKHGMKHLLRTFLNDMGGNPNKKNGRNETCLHAACQLTHNKSFSAMERHAACVAFIMQWRGATLESGGREKIDLAAQDKNGNTALHFAAASGLEHCVHVLINAGSPLFTENKEKMTPCDLAVKNGHYVIAQLLESKMVFDNALDFHNEDESSHGMVDGEEVYCGLRTQDLQEAKDQLLVETSDMLQVPLFTAEALLRDNEWSREMLLDKWMKDAVSCCHLAGVEPPQSAYSESGNMMLDSKPDSPVEEGDIVCDICMLTVKASERPSIKISCNHNFCFQCWETYLSNKILEGMQQDILCPAYQCHILVPIDVIERLVSPDLAQRYLHFDIKAFVETNKCIKWCPIAGCGRAVRLPEAEYTQPIIELKNNSNGKAVPLTSHAVDCGNGHFFCWECLGEAHAPSGCTQWRQWLEKISQIKPEDLRKDMKIMEDASNCLWLVTNSKPCPNCKSPIQKNEGCNHIKCSKCKFDFCWVCLEAWKKHSSATGGYFRCNRFPAVSKADEKQGVLISEAVTKSQQIQELNRFLHYYTRYRAHEHSRKLEEILLTTMNHKMEVLASALGNGKVTSEKEKKCTKFVEDGVRELLKARRVLCGSYVHGYYLEDLGYNKIIFELMQNELETVTEKLSEMIARPYLRTPRHMIMETTSLCRRKRHEFVRAVSKGLIPPETPPNYRKRKRFPGLLVVDQSNEDDVSHLIVASLKSVDVNNQWVKDPQGRSTNLATIYDWPEFELGEGDICRTIAVSIVGQCRTDGCGKPKARNPRTQFLQEYCSLRRNNKYNVSSSVTQTCGDVNLNKDIELPMQQQKTDVGVTTEDIIPYDETAIDKSVDYNRTNEDLTVDYFLKSLAGQDFQEATEKSANISSPHTEKTLEEKDIIAFSPHQTEDGKFEISDIHETRYRAEVSEEYCLRRVRSTGDLNTKHNRKGQYSEKPRYRLDSDHWSLHMEKLEEYTKRSLMYTKNLDNPGRGGQYSGSSVIDEPTFNKSSMHDIVSRDSVIADLEVCNILSSGENKADATNVKNLGTGLSHSSRTDLQKCEAAGEFANRKIKKNSGEAKHSNTTESFVRSSSAKNITENAHSTSESIGRNKNSGDLTYSPNSVHVNTNGNEFSRRCPERASTGKINNSKIIVLEKDKTSARSATELLNLKDPEKRSFRTKKTDSNTLVLAGSENSINETHRRAFKAAGGKILNKKDSSLRIWVGKSPVSTDSSNEYETETGIPKSPTLFISGVSISRTPEPCTKERKSPEHISRKQSHVLKSSATPKGKNYSCSLLKEGTAEGKAKDNVSVNFGRQGRSSSLTNPELDTKRLNMSYVSLPNPEIKPHSSHRAVTPTRNAVAFQGDTEASGVFSFERKNKRQIEGTNVEIVRNNVKSKSASEPEREREMFPFPKSSTDGALSSVLHVNENYLSSDDFHEVLFLLERSPKNGSKRKKRSKRERDKIKENSSKDEYNEVSSAL